MLLFTSCSTGLDEISDTVQLTPYFSAKTASAVEVAATAAPTTAAEPEPVPTPIIHIVALGETVSSIALKYDVTIDAILQANPEISPRVMVVGDEVVIPAGAEASIGSVETSTVNAIQLEAINCYFSGGGLWCSVWVENASDIDLEFPIITFSFVDESENVITEQNVPAVMRELPPGGSVPAVTFLDSVPAGYSNAIASLFSVSEARAKTGDPKVEIGEQIIEIQGNTALVSGTMRVVAEGDRDRAELNIAAVGVDINGDILGVRRQEAEVAVNESFNFSVTVYSVGGEISEVILFAEAQ